MLEIIALIFLTKKMGLLALQKGLKSGIWKVYTVLAWFGMEIFGIVIGMIFFGEENLIIGMLLGYGLAIASYFVLKGILLKKPDAINELETIGEKLEY